MDIRCNADPLFDKLKYKPHLPENSGNDPLHYAKKIKLFPCILLLNLIKVFPSRHEEEYQNKSNQSLEVCRPGNIAPTKVASSAGTWAYYH
jgi:hypothetical protein